MIDRPVAQCKSACLISKRRWLNSSRVHMVMLGANPDHMHHIAKINTKDNLPVRRFAVVFVLNDMSAAMSGVHTQNY